MNRVLFFLRWPGRGTSSRLFPVSVTVIPGQFSVAIDRIEHTGKMKVITPFVGSQVA